MSEEKPNPEESKDPNAAGSQDDQGAGGETNPEASQGNDNQPSDPVLALLDQSVAKLTEALPGVSDEDLDRLLQAEEDGKTRDTAKAAIKKEIEARQDGGGANLGDQLNSRPGGKEARGESIPDYQKPDYSGPLTGDQAAWRNRHLFQK